MGGRGTSCPVHEAPAGWLPQDVLAAHVPFGNAAVLVRTHMIPTRRDLAAVGAPLPSEDPLSAAELNFVCILNSPNSSEIDGRPLK